MAVFSKAIEREDKMSYAEPKDWMLPVRHFAGAWLLKMNKAEVAEKLYREDLVNNAGNGWALIGLAQCLKARHEKGALEYEKRAKIAFTRAEEMPGASAY